METTLPTFTGRRCISGTWKMARGVVCCPLTKLCVHRGEGVWRPTGLYRTYVNTENLRDRETRCAECPHAESAFKQVTGACPRRSAEHAGETHTVYMSFHVHRLGASGQRINFLHTLVSSIHIFNTDKCWESIWLYRSDSLRLFINPLMNMESFRPHWLFLQWCE